VLGKDHGEILMGLPATRMPVADKIEKIGNLYQYRIIFSYVANMVL